MAAIVGIDLGTTKSAIAIWENGAPRVIADADGRTTMPSVIAVDPESKQLTAGYAALELASQFPGTTITSIKRLMGRNLQEQEIQSLLFKKRILYEVEELPRRQGTIAVSVNGSRMMTPQEVSAKILQQLKATAERNLVYDIMQAVITVPAYFLETQRQATQAAGKIAGLEVVRMVNEPTAACLAFSYNKRNDTRKRLAVYDLGGGTFDISILEAGGRKPLRVRATRGNTLLGGDDIDNAIVDWLLEQINSNTRALWQQDIIAREALQAAARQAKEALSSQEITHLQVKGPSGSATRTEMLELTMTRDQLERLAQPFIDKTLEICIPALQDARLGIADIDEVLLVGGQTRMPAVQRAVGKFFGKPPNTSVPPEEAVARGAAVLAAMLAGEATGLILADVVPLSLGVKTRGEAMYELIGRNTPIPTEKAEDFSTTEDNQESIDVDVYQGEHPYIARNVLLGSFRLSGIELAPAGQPHIKITFKVDADGILHVTGQDMFTGQSKEVTITTSTRLSEDEIEEMKHEAEAHAAEYDALRLQMEQGLRISDLNKKLKTLLAEHEANWPKKLITDVKACLEIPAEVDLAERIAKLEALLYTAQHTDGKGA